MGGERKEEKTEILLTVSLRGNRVKGRGRVCGVGQRREASRLFPCMEQRKGGVSKGLRRFSKGKKMRQKKKTRISRRGREIGTESSSCPSLLTDGGEETSTKNRLLLIKNQKKTYRRQLLSARRKKKGWNQERIEMESLYRLGVQSISHQKEKTVWECGVELQVNT